MNRDSKRLGLKDVIPIAIALAALAATLGPAVIAANDGASQELCLSNLKTLAMGVQAFAQDHDGLLPRVDTHMNTVAEPTRGTLFCGEAGIEDEAALDYVQKNSIRSDLASYVKQDSTWKCPADGGCTPKPAVGVRSSSYAYRLYIAEAPVSPFFHRFYRLYEFDHPEANFIFSEIAPFHGAHNAVVPWTGKEGWAADSEMCFAFLDGHASAVQMGKIVLKSKDTPTGWDFHWPRDPSSGERHYWTPGIRDIAAEK